MTLLSGTRIGPYEIVAPLGAGGMGEVYRATDPRLARSVAIKALPEGLAADPERLARFDREAKLLASLSHPNIGAIYGLEESGGTPYLVLELVEGETLAHRLARGPLSIKETLDLGGQIAAAIEAAHDRGIVHRDLKPGNVMVTSSGAAKVLDFGLARGDEPAPSSAADFSVTPTVAVTATGPGIILGTAPYMSPEQARGRNVDRRADVWALGCVLYECLSGRQAFAGETVSDVIARVLEREPDWAALPASTPPRLRELVRRCLTKEAGDRPRDIGDLRRELSSISLELSSPSAARAAASVPSLAVLYFENLARDQESEYFCAGITEDILTDLSKIKGLRVASRNAVARYRGSPVDIGKVGAELGVRAVLEGSVRRAGDRVRITAQLINATDGFHLWAERYDRTLEDVFAVQEEIASSIASALRVTMSPAETQNLVQDRPSDVRAYDLYLKGRQRYGSYTAESIRDALDLFQEATRIDPEYALAWAGIADCYGQMMQWGAASAASEFKGPGLEAADRALAINPRLAEGYKARALIYRYCGDIERSHAELSKAIQANPRYTPALINLGVELYCAGDVAGTERLLRRALQADPQEPFATLWLAACTMVTGRIGESLTLFDRLRGLSDDPFYVTAVHTGRANIELTRGDWAAAERVIRDGAADVVFPVGTHATEALLAAATGRADHARSLVRELVKSPRMGTGVIVAAAAAAVRIGEIEAAVSFLTRPIVRDLAPMIIRMDPQLHPLLDHPPYAPRRWSRALVWPLEAGMIDPVRYALFDSVRIESAIPEGSDVAQGRA